MRRSRDMETAEFALQRIEEVKRDLRNPGEYVTKAKAAPATIMENGLLQTLAFYQEKGRGSTKPEGLLARHIEEWLIQCKHVPRDGGGAVAALINLDTPRYRRATADALALLSWIKRLGAGQIELSNREMAR